MRPLLSGRGADAFRRWIQGAVAGVTLAIGSTCLPANATNGYLATHADTVFERFAHEADLGGSFATAFEQDRDGFLWIGTEGGLARFDGYGVHLYNADAFAKDSLPAGVITSLFDDARGRLWIGTNAGGVARYDRAADRFVRYPAGRGGLRSVAVHAFADDGSGGLWIATDAGLEHLAADDRTFADPIRLGGAPGGPADEEVDVLLRDHRGTLWAGTLHGLFRRLAGQRTFDRVAFPGKPSRPLTIASVAEDGAGNVWIGASMAGAYRYDGRTGGIEQVHETGPAGSTLESETVDTIREARPGQIWLGTVGRGIVVVDAAGRQTRRIVHDPRVGSSLADNAVLKLFADRSGLLWTLTQGGICTTDPGQTAIATYLGGTGRRQTLADVDVESIGVLPGNALWFGLGNAGVDIIEPGSASMRLVRSAGGRPETALPRVDTPAFAAMPGGNVFIATLAGLYRGDRHGGNLRRVFIAGRDPAAQVLALLADRDQLWVGGAGGLWGLHMDAAGNLRPFVHVGRNRLTDARITALLAAPDGALWIATSNGIDRFDRKTFAVERIYAQPANRSALGADEAAALLLDRRRRLWVATLGSGISVLENIAAHAPRRFFRIAKPQGLQHDNVDGLVADRHGIIWASTDSGLARIDPATLAVRTFRRAEGVAISNYYTKSAAMDSAGDLLFGGVGGATVVHPDRVRPWPFVPPIAVTDVSIGGRPVAVTRFNGGGSSEPIAIGPNANSVRVEFAALDFTSPERNRYAYRLDGFDSDWIETDARRRVAAYTNLAPGSYRLRLRGSNRDGVWNARELVVPIRVIPAWHQTVWFHLLEVIAAAGLVATLVMLRTRLLQRREHELEAEVERRTAELRESQRQLEKLAYRDLLTGLPNRRMFNDEFRRFAQSARRRNESFGLLLIDLDRFKHINDTHGHAAGDALLVEAAARFTEAVRETDCIARLGGDEFAILVADVTHMGDIQEICRRIVERFEDPLTFGAIELRTSASIGVAVFPEDGANQGSLYKAADLALYEAKREGRNCWRWYSTALEV